MTFLRYSSLLMATLLAGACLPLWGALSIPLGGNLPVEAKMTVTRFSSDGTNVAGSNLLYSGTPTTDTRLYMLPDGGSIIGEFHGDGSHVTNSDLYINGSFTLFDDGDFSLIFEDGYVGDDRSYAPNSFNLTFSGLLTPDGSYFDGFTFTGGDGDFIPLVNFDFSDAANGTISIMGNIPADRSFSGTFTVVPEPMTTAAILAGLVGVLAFWRRQRRA